ncbi:NADH dehydrogenase FAD-containing subunit [Sporolactobacillus sp. STCC-11]|uniref:NADH dehydrogenase FAD-containing subunit n=1 Tax=Sporolactobacillus caesalpiniae TaxID=3230362 RepID=UPI0033948193
MLIELKKMMKHRELYISLICLGVVVLAAVSQSVQGYYSDHELFLRLYKNYPDALTLLSPHTAWMGMTSGTSHGFFHLLFYFIFPFLIAIPIVDTIYRERNSGNLDYVWIRKKRSVYYRNKFIFSFAFSFFLFLIPVILSIILVNLMTGHWDYTSYSEVYVRLVHGHVHLPDSIFSSAKVTLFSNALSRSPYFYIFIYYIMDALYAGAYICLGLALSLFVKNRYLVYFMPQMIHIGLWILLSMFGNLGWIPFYFLTPNQAVGGLSYPPLIINFFILVIIAGALYLIGVRRKIDLLP